MALTDSERAELDASPQLAKFNKVLALYSYNAIAFVGHGQSLSDIYDRIAIATVTTTNASIELSEQCGDGCYWDQELGVCVCQGGFQTQADAQSASAREKKSSGKTKKTGNNKGKKAEKAKKGGRGK
jgi:hypothetical protein